MLNYHHLNFCEKNIKSDGFMKLSKINPKKAGIIKENKLIEETRAN